MDLAADRLSQFPKDVVSRIGQGKSSRIHYTREVGSDPIEPKSVKYTTREGFEKVGGLVSFDPCRSPVVA